MATALSPPPRPGWDVDNVSPDTIDRLVHAEFKGFEGCEEFDKVNFRFALPPTTEENKFFNVCDNNAHAKSIL